MQEERLKETERMQTDSWVGMPKLNSEGWMLDDLIEHSNNFYEKYLLSELYNVKFSIKQLNC